MLDLQKNAKLRVAAMAFAVLAVGAAAYSLWRTANTPRGSDRDAVALICTACKAESEVSSATYRGLALDENTGSRACPQCGAMAAVVFASRCPHCDKGVIPQPMGSPMVCPHCSKSLLPDDIDMPGDLPATQ